MDNVYFANLPPEEIADALLNKIDNYYETIDRNGRLGLWRKAHKAYFGMDENGSHKGSVIGRGGVQGELHKLSANHYRNLLQHLHVLVTQQRPTFECRATNTDYKSQIQTILGTNVLEYYMREKRLSDQFRKAVEFSILYGESYISVEYDQTAGEIAAVDPYTGEVIKTGDIVVRVHEPINVVRRIRADSDSKQDWYIIRRWENKYDLAAKYPDISHLILSGPSGEISRPFATLFEDYQIDEEEDEIIPVYYFVHDKTPACPAGREVSILSDKTVLEYKDLSYDIMPVKRMSAYTQDGTSFGYSVSFDLLCIQEAIDNLYTIITTNQMTFGVQNLWVPPGSNISTNQLVDGLNVIQSQQKPEPINLTHTPPEIFNFVKGLEGLGETLSGVNSVARGQPEASLKSGAALALVASQAVQFSNGIQSAYIQLLEDVGTCILKTLQQKAMTPRVAVIAGKDRRSYIKEFTGEDLAAINRVIVDVGSPVSQTIAGRIEMATNLLQQGLLKRPEQYIQVVTTGRLENVTSDQESESLLIQRENEALRDGEITTAIAVDQHVEHIKGHRAVLADPQARKDPKVVEAALAHIQEHIELLSVVDPRLLNALGQAPLGPTPQDQGAAAVQPNAQPQDPNQMPVPQGASPEIAANMPSLPENTPPQMIPQAS